MKPNKTAKSAKKGWAARLAPSAGLGGRMFAHLPYFFFVSALALVMVWNVYRGQRMVKAIQVERAEVSDLRSHSSALLSQINNENKQSAVLQRMRQRNIGVTGSSPRRLIAENSR